MADNKTKTRINQSLTKEDPDIRCNKDCRFSTVTGHENRCVKTRGYEGVASRAG